MNHQDCFVVGVDFGTASVRAAVIRIADGREVASATYKYQCGVDGCLHDAANPLVARQNPEDYLNGFAQTVREALDVAAQSGGVDKDNVLGIGFDTTGSTILPVLRDGTPLVFLDEFKNNPNAHIWLWKDHSGWAEAEEITATAKKLRPEYLDLVGGIYSSEWYWSKVLHCLRLDKPVFDTAYTWIEVADWLLFTLTGGTDVADAVRAICPAGHKALFDRDWGGYPADDFLGSLSPDLLRLKATLDPHRVHHAGTSGFMLSQEWTAKFGLPKPVMVAIPAFDAHYGGIGAGIKPGILVKTIGTSTCDLMVSPLSRGKLVVPGMAGIVRDSILPGYYGIEAGQSAVGDIFNWFVNIVRPCNQSYGDLSTAAAALQPGESGLLALDWMNGNRTILVDQRLSGLILGLTLHSKPAEIYRALIEATAFGARVIHDQMEANGLPIDKVIVCGGIPRKDSLFMQIYADVVNKPLFISRNSETCALGGAIAAAVITGAYPSFEHAIDKMTGVLDTVYRPIPENVTTYKRIYELYRQMHDSFCSSGSVGDLSRVMKDLMDIKDETSRRDEVILSGTPAPEQRARRILPVEALRTI
ncbi:MAG: ribulokinase [Planctomycetaceae bacterium]|nr:ribulokinase [Planctomycetaceae bacterium]